MSPVGKLSSDMSFVLLACQSEMDEKQIAEFREHVERSDALEEVAMLAYRHGVYSLFHRAVLRYSPDLIDEEMNEALDYLDDGIKVKNEGMTAELLRVISLLEAADIDVLSFKGPVLAQMLYGDIALRQYVDLDLLIKKEDIEKIETLLISEGYIAALELTPVQKEVWKKTRHDLGFKHHEKGIKLEMHWALLDDDYPVSIALSDVWKYPQKVRINEQNISTFSIEELFSYLCVHGSKHLWERLAWIKDIDVFIRTKEIEWESLIKKAESSRLETMIELGLSLSLLLFKTPLPREIEKRLEKNTHFYSLKEYVIASWESPQSTFKQHAAVLKLFPSTHKKIFYLNNILIKPSYKEFTYIDLSKGLYGFYYLIRPYLLVRKYLLYALGKMRSVK